MKVCIVGVGYVGLVTGACFAARGHTVRCVDKDPAKIKSIQSGIAPIHEDGLDALLQQSAGRTLTAQTSIDDAVAEAEVILVCVGTPFKAGHIDLSYIIAAAEDIGRALRTSDGYKLVVMKSTVIPGTTDGVFREALERASGKKAGRDFGLGMNPEFLTEGTAVRDFMEPDRIVVGGIDQRSCDMLLALYAPWLDVPRLVTNPGTAEMIKYTSNSVLAALISFSNEIGRLCAALPDIDVAQVMKGVHLAGYFTHTASAPGRVVAPITSFLGAGCGYGGSCLPKDVSALVSQGRSLGVGMPLLQSVLDINAGQPAEVLKLIRKHYPSLDQVKVSVLGVAFKPDTDDMRESPAFPIVDLLREAGAVVTAYDPIAKPAGLDAFRDVAIADSLDSALDGAEVIVLVTSWKEFHGLGARLTASGATPLVIDGRRFLDRKEFARYEGIGLQAA